MNGTRAYSFDCLRVPGLHLPKAGIAFPTVLLQILTVQFVIQIFHFFIFARSHLTPIVMQMFAGLLLAPSTPWANNKVCSIFHVVIFPDSAKNVEDTLALLSFVIYTFLVAVKMDFSIVLKTGRKAFVIGGLDVLVPIIVDFCILMYLYPDFVQRLEERDQAVQDLYINLTTLPLTHFQNVAVFLTDMKMINSELGRLALSSSLIGHMISICLLIVTNIITRPVPDHVQLVTPIVLLVFSIFVLRPLLKWMVKQTPKGRPVRQVFVFSAYLLMFVGALTTHFSGQLLFFGAFIMGCITPDGPPLGSAVVERFDFFVSGMLLPFFVTTAVMGGDYMRFSITSQTTLNHISLALLAYLAKFINSLVCGLYNRMDFSDALTLSFIMSIKGIIDVGTLNVFKEAQVLSTPNYTVMLLWAILIATITPICVKSLYRPLKKYAGYQRRDIIHCKHNSELRILISFMRPDRVNSFTRLINACCPSENNVVVVYALHLVKLVGRAHPIFIAHDTQKKKDSSNSYSAEVIWAFYRFQQTCKNFLTVSIFTCVSPLDAMHEDTCTLALDKLVSIIVLPFHRSFRIDGSIDLEDTKQRILNCDLLKRSPCSVGILVDRGNFANFGTSITSLNTVITADYSSSPLIFMVAVIYIGGLDDQETLAFAKRMARDSRVKVDVTRLVAAGKSRDLDSLDSAALTDIQRNVLYNQQFSYTEREVKDGADTAAFIKTMVECYNLVMVGRHYNSACNQLMGLKDMSEDTELGALGDLLASQDLKCKTSVLVVQQQRHWVS
ncbi:hypothetical protein V2J09_007434 [Rumex salicifolius]